MRPSQGVLLCPQPVSKCLKKQSFRVQRCRTAFGGAAIRPGVDNGVGFAHWGCGCCMPSFSEAKIRTARPRERAYKLYDERGLFLLVTATGARMWRLRYQIGNLEKQISLVYSDVPFKGARERRDEARRLVDGRD